MNKGQLIHNLAVIMPELWLTLVAMVTLVLGVVRKKFSPGIGYAALIAITWLIYLMYNVKARFIGEAFNASFINNDFTIIFKSLILIGLIMILLSYIRMGEASMEFIVLAILSIIGGFIAISARDLIVLFMGLELQSLPSYILAGFLRDRIKSSEAGLKYFVLGALSSAILLFGISLIYGFTGSISYPVISYKILHITNIGVIIGASMVLVSIMFKLSAAPFHMWTPDVYEGAPINSVALFSSIHKLAVLAILVTFLALVVGKVSEFFIPLIKFVAVLSLLVGAFGGILQNSVKRLLAYSTIFNAGFMLLAIIVDIYLGIWRPAFLTYMVIYAVTIIGFFAILTSLFGERAHDISLKDLAGLSYNNKLSSACVVIFISSIVGIPPLAGFFAKYYILYDLISIEEYELAFCAILASVVSAFYYLKIVKAIYFDEQNTKFPAEAINTNTALVVSTALFFLISFVQYFAEYFNSIKLCI